MSVIEGLKRAAASNASKTAVICGSTRFSFSEEGRRINRLSNALCGLGVTRGDRVAVLALNCHRFLEFYYGVPQMGAVVVPVNFRLPPQEIKYILDHSGARVVAVDAALAPALEEIRPRLETVEHFISISDHPGGGYIAYEELLARSWPEFDQPEIADQDLLGLFYTSGTTAEPKGVMLTHKNVTANVAHSEPFWQYVPGDIYLHAAPMFHLADGATVYSNFARGTTQACVARFEPKAVLEMIERERISTTVLVPTMINFLLQEPELSSYDLTSLRQITYGASPIAPDLLRRAMKAFGCRFSQGYGLTEASPLLTVLTADDHAITDEKSERRLASCGRPVPGVEVRVVKEDGSDVRPGEVGEIIARGPNVMAGYWRREEDTANAILDGWLRTGDLATVDEDGYLYLVDRKKDMIVTGGENVYSTEVEAALYAHPAVKEAAVIPIPHAGWGESVHACVTLRDGEQAAPEELIDFCRDRLASYKLPRSVEIMGGELPKGGTGKILKKQLRERHWRGQSRRIS
ncbi:MAG TPA: long-chain-fatty-acid--CoA ligase [Blastocatellia bacterium]|jgi:long-chain acyl-CoA synthetase|nr:long-chain-fatty-acid--CoA ligase [Blastocatellia bacterium]